MHILTLTPFYPVAADDAQGCFIAEPLRFMEEFGAIHSVIAVQPFYRGKAQVNTGAFPACWKRYFAIPGGVGLASSGAFLYASLISEVRKLHQDNAIDLIHAHAPLPCGHAAALLGRELKIPFVVSVHGLDAFADKQVKGQAGGWCRRVSQYVFRSSKRVICISECVRERVLEGIANCRTSVVYNGVDTELFSLSEDATNLPSQVLSVGNLIPIKGHELLLRALSLIRKRYPGVSCEIIGEGPERLRLEALVNKLGLAGNVSFRGRCSRAQVAEAMRRCTLFVLPSRYEGLGCVYLEAMCAGKPAVACRGQGIEEIIQHGANGWLVGTEDVRELADGLDRLLGDGQLRSRIGHAARQTVLPAFTLRAQAEHLSHIYRESLA